MNSRIENGSMTLNSKKKIDETVGKWFQDGEISDVYEVTEHYIAYESEDEITRECRIYYPEADSAKRIRSEMVFDKKVLDFINPDALAEFMFKCIDVNALAVLQGTALLYDEYDEDGCRKLTEGRSQLMYTTGGGGDEYAMEICSEHQLGIMWHEYSKLIINIRALEETSIDIAKEDAALYTGSENNWPQYFAENFQRGFLQTILHEMRHLFYASNEFTPVGNESYPEDGELEQHVEAYGNLETELLETNRKALPLIHAVFADRFLSIHAKA